MFPIVLFDVLEQIGIDASLFFTFDLEGQEKNKEYLMDQMDSLGYDSHNVILNLSTLYFVLMYYFVKLAIFLILHLAKRRENRAYKSLTKSIFWGELIQIMIESFMELYIAGYLEI